MATAKKIKKLAKGDSVVIRNRLYALVDESGKIVEDDGVICVYATRAETRQLFILAGERVIRLNDLTGVVL